MASGEFCTGGEIAQSGEALGCFAGAGADSAQAINWLGWGAIALPGGAGGQADTSAAGGRHSS